MSTPTAHRSTTHTAADQSLRSIAGRTGVAEEYLPTDRHAPRSAQRIAMLVRREQDRRQSGW